MMNFSEYKALFPTILNARTPTSPYDNPDYFSYLKLNDSRQNRWLKHGVLTDETIKAITSISEKQQWLVITEPWCGDAAHNVPFIVLMADLNPLIELTFELRDSEPFSIEQYLTNGGKSIPKLIIRDAQGNDLHTWGPRPEVLQTMHEEMKKVEMSFEDQKIALQNWYNENKGIDVQKEIIALF